MGGTARGLSVAGLASDSEQPPSQEAGRGQQDGIEAVLGGNTALGGNKPGPEGADIGLGEVQLDNTGAGREVDDIEVEEVDNIGVVEEVDDIGVVEGADDIGIVEGEDEIWVVAAVLEVGGNWGWQEEEPKPASAWLLQEHSKDLWLVAEEVKRLSHFSHVGVAWC